MSAKKKKKEKIVVTATSSLVVGSEFKLFKKGSVCKVTAIENGKVKFESNAGITGSFPIAKLNMHV